MFHCFSCQAKGKGAIDFVQQLRKGGFQDAVNFLTVITPTKAPIASPEVVSEPIKGYSGKYEKYKVPCEWLDKRIPRQIQELYGVFCYNNPARKSAYSGRVMIPVGDVVGQLYGYLGRHVPDNPPNQQTNKDIPKYLFPNGLEKSKYLFGAHELSSGKVLRPDGQFHQAPVRVVYLVESPFCVMKFASYGLPAVSPFGWSVSEEQRKLLQSICRGLVYIPDKNKYDQATNQAAALCQAMWCRMPTLPAGIDDPEYLNYEQILAL